MRLEGILLGLLMPVSALIAVTILAWVVFGVDPLALYRLVEASQ